MKKILALFGAVLFLATTACCSQEMPIANRILVQVDERVISLLDVVKEIDFLLQRQAPPTSCNRQFRCQFYQQNWRRVLTHMIEEELILADAKRLQCTVSLAQIHRYRQRHLQGLDRAAAQARAERELLIQQMRWLQIEAKAQQCLLPAAIRQRYAHYCRQQQAHNRWHYWVLALRPQGHLLPRCLREAERLFRSATTAQLPQVVATLQQTYGAAIDVQLHPFVDAESAIANSHLTILKTLQEGQKSAPVAQKSRWQQETIWRLFYLEKCRRATPLPLAKVSSQLQAEILAAARAKARSEYLAQLSQEFGCDPQHCVSALADLQIAQQ